MKFVKVSSNKLILQPTESKAKYNIVFNDRVVAEVLLDIDGCYKLQIEGGLWEAYHVLKMAQMVIELNKPYEEELKDYFDTQESWIDKGIIEF